VPGICKQTARTFTSNDSKKYLDELSNFHLIIKYRTRRMVTFFYAYARFIWKVAYECKVCQQLHLACCLMGLVTSVATRSLKVLEFLVCVLFAEWQTALI
jgi:hypothetical protein